MEGEAGAFYLDAFVNGKPDSKSGWVGVHATLGLVVRISIDLYWLL